MSHRPTVAPNKHDCMSRVQWTIFWVRRRDSVRPLRSFQRECVFLFAASCFFLFPLRGEAPHNIIACLMNVLVWPIRPRDVVAWRTTTMRQWPLMTVPEHCGQWWQSGDRRHMMLVGVGAKHGGWRHRREPSWIGILALCSSTIEHTIGGHVTRTMHIAGPNRNRTTTIRHAKTIPASLTTRWEQTKAVCR